MLKVKLGEVEYKNPVVVASGTFGFGAEYGQLYDLSELGGICTKGLTLLPREGNDGLRVAETASGMMNSVGLQNPGIDHFITEIYPTMKQLNTQIVVNVGGGTLEEYAEAVSKLEQTDVATIELNISCPNVKQGGMSFGIKSVIAKEIVREIRVLTNKHLMVKLSPNAEDIVGMACACVEAGADSLSLVNTFKALAIDTATRKAVFDHVYAGLSGPAIKPIALRMVHEVSKQVNVPVVGIGGIMNADDALQFIMAGATAVQVGTANFVNPLAAVEIVKGIETYLDKHQIQHISEICGII